MDFIPSRGAKNKAADSWVEMDPSYKQYTYKKGLDAAAISGLDPNQLAQSFSGTVNDAEGWATGFDPTILQNAQSQAQQKLQAYIQANLSSYRPLCQKYWTDGMTWDIFQKNWNKVQASRRERINEIMVILEDDNIFPWP